MIYAALTLYLSDTNQKTSDYLEWVEESSALATVSIPDGSPFNGCSAYQNDTSAGSTVDAGIRFQIRQSAVTSGNGELFSLTYKVKENAPSGELTFSSSSALNFYSSKTKMNKMALEEFSITISGEGGGSQDSGTPVSGGGQANIGENTVDYAWSYGGSIAEDNGTFTITPYTADGVTYVIDAVYVDGTAVEVTDPTTAMTVTNASSSVFASFAYTLNFPDPANGTLSVSRGGETLTSGSIVRGGDILTITATPDSGYELDALTLVGVTENSDDTYTVTAQNGDPTPAITASFQETSTETTYAITTVGAGVSCTVNGVEVTEALPGSTVTVSVTPPEGQVLDTLTLAYDGSTTDITSSRSFTMPAAAVTVTASFVNDLPPVQQLPPPTITSESGTTTVDKRGELVEITCAESGAVIYYTVDGTDPTESSTQYSAANMYSSVESLPAGPVTIKAIAVKEGWTNSEVATATFTVITGAETHSITVQDGSEGITFTVGGKSGVTEASQGAAIVVSVTPPGGKILKKLTYTSGSSTFDITSTKRFTMPYADVTIAVEYEDEPRYTITAGEGVTFTVDGQSGVTEAYEGAAVAVSVAVPEHYTLKSLTYTYGGSTVDIASAKKFTMPAADVAITAVIEAIPQRTLQVQSPISNGTVTLTANGQTLTSGTDSVRVDVYVGQTVTVTVTPDAGYRLDRLAYNYTYPSTTSESSLAYPNVTAAMLESSSITTSFTMPDANVYVTAAFAQSSGTGNSPDSTGGNVLNWTVVQTKTDGELAGKPSEEELNYSLTGRVLEVHEEVLATTTIWTEKDLRNLAIAVNNGEDYTATAVILANDVTLTEAWTPIGTQAYPFQGIFDGGGHTIDGLNITLTAEEITQDTSRYYGLFGYAGDGTVIRNLTVSGEIAVTGEFESNISFCLGGIAGSVTGASLLNCTSLVDITSVNGSVGGITGYVSTRAVLTSCANYGSLSVAYDGQNGNMGGIAGYAASSAQITQCANYGAIETSCPVILNNSGKPFDDVTGRVGGLVGVADNGITITNSCNKGAITSKAASTGGLIGVFIGSKTATSKLTNCYNTGAVTFTAQNNSKNPAYAAGLVGSFTNNTFWPVLTNCYSAGTVSKVYAIGPDSGEAVMCTIGEITTLPFKTLENTYGPSDSDKITAAQMGNGYKADVNNINGGSPLLAWESESGSGQTSQVTFVVTPADAIVTVYRDSALTQAVGTGTSFQLEQGTYFYRATVANYEDAIGSFTVTIRPVTVSVTLKQTATVTFQVSPADAEFFLTQSDSEDIIQPDSTEVRKDYAVYTYTLYDGTIYVYNAYAKDYNGTSHEYAVSGDAMVLVQLTKRGVATDTVWGDGNVDRYGEELPHIIDHGGSYYIGEEATGVITIDTTEEVTLVGTGVGLRDAFEDLYIDCVQAGSDLTLQDVFISNTSGTADPKMTNMIDFNGWGNYLTFEGVSILDQDTNATGYAMIHVGSSTELTVSGGVAYLYKNEQGAGIGGNGGADGSDGQSSETNGTITIRNAELFMKNAKQGAAIGAGAQARGQKSGAISIENSTLYMIANSRGATIGGSAGSSGASSGSTVYVDEDSTITINVNFTGAAIGGGGYDSGNDADGGTLIYSGGSIRTYLDTNAVGYWNVLSAGVNGNAAITADVVDSRGNDLYLLEFDTTLLSKSASRFTVEDEDGDTIYSGGLHEYRYINEDVDKYGESSISYTIDNWVPLDDPCLYLYLPGEDQTISVNGQKFSVTWTGYGFTVGPAKTAVLVTTEIIDGIAYTTVDSDALIEALEDIEADSQLVIEADVSEADARYLYGAVTTLTVNDVWYIAMADMSLLISSPIADMELRSAALEDIAGQRGREVTFSAIEEKDGVHIEVAVDERVMETVEGGLWVTLPVETITAGTVVVLVDEDGNETILDDAEFGRNSVTVWVEGSCILKVTERAVKLLAITVVKDGVATTTIDSKVLAEVLKSADESTQLVIEVVIPEGESVYESTTILTQKDTKAIADSGASLEIDSPLSDVVLSNAALKDLAGRNGKEITVTSTEQKSGTSIKLAVDGKTVGTVTGGLLVSLPVKTTAGSVMVLVDAYGGETVIKKSAVGKYAVTARLAGSCTVKVIDNAKTFTDVQSTDWYADAVAFVTAHELFNGVGDGALFDPNGSMTRGMLVTVLHRLEDTPAPGANLFSDVPAGAWYADAVVWANGNRIVAGDGSGSFFPENNLTREQLATILYRYMQYLGLDVSARSSLSRFSDGGETSTWAAEAMQWAVGAGIITGRTNGDGTVVLDPLGSASRAEVATMLQRLINLMVQ